MISDPRKPKPPPGIALDESSPNAAIDRAIQGLMQRVSPLRPGNGPLAPLEETVKVINLAIAWEKVKHQISDKEDGFNPDNL